MKIIPNQLQNRRALVSIVILLVVVGSLVLTLEKTHVIDLYHKPKTTASPQTTSNAKTAQENFTGGSPREAGNTLTENKGSADVNDTKGSQANIGTNNPITSKSGEITVYSPTNDQLIKPGVAVSGTSKLGSVSYRIIDNISGVISSGDLSVVNGKFSGTLNFATNATAGRVDFYATRIDGTEYSNIEIPVRFK